MAASEPMAGVVDNRIGISAGDPAREAAKLNQEGIPTRPGKPWHGVVINRILTGKR